MLLETVKINVIYCSFVNVPGLRHHSLTETEDMSRSPRDLYTNIPPNFTGHSVAHSCTRFLYLVVADLPSLKDELEYVMCLLVSLDSHVPMIGLFFCAHTTFLYSEVRSVVYKYMLRE